MRAVTAPSPQQRAASDPARSVWVSANAGSGKTTVLVNRVVRLLLAGADPARILCVTFTKAAAANMQDRIFRRLGGWVALPEEALAREIADMEGRAPDAAALQAARRLFARAVETPGGLKIQTIHSFCERLLHLFPFEAAVPARFEMMDEAQAKAALDRATAGTLRAALGDGGGPLGDALRTATDAAGEDGVREALAAFVAQRRTLPGRGGERKFAQTPLRQALGLTAGETAEGLRRQLFNDGLPAANWQEVAAWLDGGGKTDRERATELRQSRGVQGHGDSERYIAIFLTKDCEPRKTLATKDLIKSRPDLAADLTEEQERVVAMLHRIRAAEAAERTEAIIRLADDALARYEGEKRRLGRLDFADLIGKAKALLTSDSARWVLYKLDQGVDHVLVDEAQDTSPEQWAIIKAVTDDFFSGAGARGGVARTVFAVGDEKQSIYGFQGAKPEAFDEARRHYAARIEAHNAEAERPHAFRKEDLHISYRTTGDILAAVDQVFSLADNFTGLESETRPTVHGTNRLRQPGLVELWPPEQPPPKEQDGDDAAPVDARPPDSASRRLADRIARRIRWWMDTGARLAASGRPISPGDVLVLVRNRGPIFDDVIKALKKRKVPLAGADRMKLLEQIAVLDLLSLGRFCLLQEDDLALAEVLKSPLIGFTDATLEAVAAGRGPVSLWSVLQARTDAPFAEAAGTIAGWIDLAASLDPLRFYAAVLAEGGARRRLIQRLGPDAAEAIDVFHYRLRQWQAANPPSLRLFLETMSGDESDVKRDMEDAHGRVRVMTVHGSKGLEAPIVFLADVFTGAGGRQGPRLIEAVPGEPETAAWTPRKNEDPAALAHGRAHLEAQQAAEHRRLLYVALTRAADRLYIAGAQPERQPTGHWQGMIDAALTGHACVSTVPDEAGDGEVRQWRTVFDTPAAPTEDAPAESDPEPFPWLRARAAADLPRPPPIRPSRLADAAEPPPLREATARRSAQRLRGDLMHLLFQHLPDTPPDRRAATGAALARARYGALGEAVREEALQSVLDLLGQPRWAALFGREARAEVEIAGRIAIGGESLEVAGRIDRLLIARDRVTVLDFKTGRPPANLCDASEGHLRQLAVYRALAQDLYPDRPVEAAILWTATPDIAVLEDAALDGALARISLAR
jgi:ATP-dependent helicase/nuclease subunit A